MSWQEVVAGLIVFGAAAYVVQRFRGSSDRSSSGPDVPVANLTRKQDEGRSCGDETE